MIDRVVISKKKTLSCLVFIMLLLQPALQNSSISVVGFVFRYLDEVICLICTGYVLLKFCVGQRFKNYDLLILVLWGLFLIVELLSSVSQRYQSVSVSIADAFICSKFIIGFMGVRMLFMNKDTIGDIRKSLSIVAKFYLSILGVLLLHELVFTPWFHEREARYGIRTIQLFYPHPTSLAAIVIILLLVIAAGSIYCFENMWYLVLASIMIISTTRVKAIAFIVIFWTLYFLMLVFKVKSKFIYTVFGTILAIFIGYQQVLTYFFTTKWSARSQMMKDGLRLALKKFPLGCGFGTFGSHMSVQAYSPIYVMLGYNQINGLSKKTAAYNNDGFWQLMLGQFGFFGVAVMILIIIYFFMKTVRIGKLRGNSMIYLSLISLNVYMLIDTFGELSYFSPFGITYFMFFAMALSEGEALLKKNSEKNRGQENETTFN